VSDAAPKNSLHDPNKVFLSNLNWNVAALELKTLCRRFWDMTSEFYFHHRYNWHTYDGFVRFAQKAFSKGECWLYEACALLTSVGSRDAITFLPARRTLALEKFKYAFESWRQTPAIEGCEFLQLFNCNA
jgi:hypothetical protein